MKKLFILFSLIAFCLFLTISIYAQTEIKGSGTSSTTHTLVLTNSNSPVDTLMVVKDGGNVGVGTTSPSEILEVNGWIYPSGAGNGIRFHDGTTQTTAATGGSVAYQDVITVAQSGGDFNTITGALGSLPPTPPPYGPGSAWHIRVMPGVYTESITVPDYVHLKGAGKYATFIDGTVTLSDTCLIEDFSIWQGVICNGTSPTILHNIITNNNPNGDGISITSGGHPWIKENEIIDCAGLGIFNAGFVGSGPYPWIIANKILRNKAGGIVCYETSPTISNNRIFNNSGFGIFMMGNESPAEPTIDDNVIGSTDSQSGGIGIQIQGLAEPRIIANDIYLCEIGIEITTEFPQPSIIGNNINYNYDSGIFCSASGVTKPVVIKSNHIHSNGHPPSGQPAGIWLAVNTGQGGSPIITHNNIHNNPHDPSQPQSLMGWDIYYGSSNVSMNISLNVFDYITNASAVPPPPVAANGSFNVNSLGNTIIP